MGYLTSADEAHSDNEASIRKHGTSVHWFYRTVRSEFSTYNFISFLHIKLKLAMYLICGHL
jgi:hypothetical protein